MMQATSHRPLPHYDRIRGHSAPVVNERIDRMTTASIRDAVGRGRDGIVQRIAELDGEWDIDRVMMVNFAVAGGAALLIGLRRFVRAPLLALRIRPRRKGFLYLFGAQLGFLLMHAGVGWCPPSALFRRLGIRSRREIDAERTVLVRASERRRAVPPPLPRTEESAATSTPESTARPATARGA
jgi:hypothetical protein